MCILLSFPRGVRVESVKFNCRNSGYKKKIGKLFVICLFYQKKKKNRFLDHNIKVIKAKKKERKVGC